MHHLKVSGAVRPLKWSLGVKWLSTEGSVMTDYERNGTGCMKEFLCGKVKRDESADIAGDIRRFLSEHVTLLCKRSSRNVHQGY